MRPCRSVWTYPIKLHAALDASCTAANVQRPLRGSSSTFFFLSLMRAFSSLRMRLEAAFARMRVYMVLAGKLRTVFGPTSARRSPMGGSRPAHRAGRTLHFCPSADIPRGGPCQFGYRCRSQLVQTHLTGRQSGRDAPGCQSLWSTL